MGALTLAITGATGFLGKAVVAEARSRGHSLRLLLRNSRHVPAAWRTDRRIVIFEGSLADSTPEAFAGADAVLHLAAALKGNDAVQEAETLGATRAVLAAMAGTSPPPRLVLASSVSVFGGMRAGDTVSESTPLEQSPRRRDAYTRAKLVQEALARDYSAATNAPVAILRIGAIWGPGRLWNDHLGIALGPLLLRTGSGGQIPITNLHRAAKMVIRAAEVPLEGAQVAVVLDNDLPDRERYVRAMRRGGWPRHVLSLGWPLMRALSVFGVLPGAPGLLRAPVQRARIMPLRYTSQAKWLGESDCATFEEGMNAALAAQAQKHD